MIFRKALILVLLLAVAGCAVPNKVVKIYFYNADKLVFVERELPSNESPLVIAIDQLMKGPNEQEVASGIVTEIPVGTRARNVNTEGNMAIIDLNSRLLEYDGDNIGAKRILAQIVYTATSIPKIDQVILKIQGDDQFTFGKEGFVIDHPIEKGDVKN